MSGHKFINSRGSGNKAVTMYERGRTTTVHSTVPAEDPKLREAEQRARAASAKAAEAEQKTAGLEATVKLLNESIEAAREEAANLREELKRRDEEVTESDKLEAPDRIDVVTVDSLDREGAAVLVRGCVQFGTVVADPVVVSFPFDTLREIVRQKVSHAKSSEVRSEPKNPDAK